MTRILVTGASGFIGRQVVSILCDRGDEVHAASFQSAGFTKAATWHQADLLDADQRRALVERVRPQRVLHVAWIAIPGVYWTSPLNDQWLAATLDLLSLCIKQGTERFVGAGSCAEYDWSYGRCDENTTPLHPSTPYGIAKAACGRSVIDTQGISTAWGRIFHLYGPYEPRVRLVASVIISLLQRAPARCSHGKQVRDILHVRDVAAGFVALLDSGVTGAVNIASGKPVTLREVVETIAQQLDGMELVQFGALPASSNDPPVLTADVGRLQHEVGWQPAYSLNAGIADTIKWWKNIAIE